MLKFAINILWSKFVVPAVVCLLLGMTAFSSFNHLQSLYFERLEQTMRSQLGTLHQSLSAWGRSKRGYVYSWAKQPELQRHIKVLTGDACAPLKKLSSLALEDYLRPVISDPEIKHFYLIGPGNRIIASDNPDQLGLTAPLVAFPYLLRQAWGACRLLPIH